MPIDVSIYNRMRPVPNPMQTLGQLAELKTQQINQQTAQQNQQINAVKLQEVQRAQQAQQQANQVIANLPKLPTGEYDVGGLLQGMASANVPIEEQQRAATTFDGLNKIMRSVKQGHVDANAEIANVLLQAHPDTKADPITADDVHHAYALSKDMGLPVSDDDEQAVVNMMAQGADPEKVLKTARSLGSKWAKPDELKEVPAGGSLVAISPGGGAKTLFQGKPKVETVAEQELDAATLGTPQETSTAATSAKAVKARQDALANKPITPYESAQLKETERLRNIEAGNLTVAQQRERRESAAQQAIPTAGMAVPDVPAGQKNEQFLATLPPQQGALVKALAEGRMQFPAGFALRSPYWQGLLQAVAKYDPSFDAVNYNARAKTRADFTSGKSAQNVNAINTVIGHLSELSDKADALQNSPIQFVNTVKNWMRTQSGAPEVTNFNTAKKAVADELTRVWRQSGGAEADIKSWQTSLDAANSPAQLHEAFETIGGLLESKLGALQTQYGQGMGTNDVQMISPPSRQALNKLERKGGGGGGMIRARDQQGKLHEAPAGTALPPGWTLEK